MNCNVVKSCNYWNENVIFGYDENWLFIKNDLENINISFINTIIYPSYDMNKYVLCNALNIRLYLYIID